MIKEKFTVRTNEMSINVVQTETESIRKKDITKTGLRVYDDGLIGVAGAIGSFDEGALEKQAIDSLESRVPYPYEVSREKQMELDYTHQAKDDANLIEEVDDMLHTLKKCQDSFSFSNKINVTSVEERLANTNGLNLRYRDRFYSISLLFKEKTSVNIIDGGIEYRSRKYDSAEFIKYTNQVCDAYKLKVSLPQGKRLPVIFSSSDMLPLLMFAKDLNGQMFIGGGSLFSNKIGKKAFSNNFTLYQSLNPDDYITSFFDAEGIVNEGFRYPLIKDGVLISPYTDKKTSKMLNLPLTGSAVSDYDGVPSVGFRGFKIEESLKTAKELLGGDMGIFVMIASGGDFTPEGNFSTPVQLAMLFDGERFIGRLPELSISSNVFEMFGEAYRGVSSDAFFSLSGEKCLVMDLNVSEI